MVLAKRYCVTYIDGMTDCGFRDGFWYTQTGIIVKWSILAGIFIFFMAWFVGGYLHAKSRLRKGLPLMGYHRWLVSYSDRRKFGQTPQNHFTFYAAQPYAQRNDGTYSEPPPQYYGNDPPPSYMPPPPGATKMDPNQGGMDMPPYGMAPAPTQAYPMGAQQTGVTGGNIDVESQAHTQPLPPRPQQAKLGLSKFVSRLRK